MPYRNPCVVLELESHGWVDLKLFRSTLRWMLYKNMSEPSNRTAAADAIDALVRNAQPAPFGEHTRFPAAAMYVDVDHPYVSSRLDTVAAALYDRQDVRDDRRPDTNASLPLVSTRNLPTSSFSMAYDLEIDDDDDDRLANLVLTHPADDGPKTDDVDELEALKNAVRELIRPDSNDDKLSGSVQKQTGFGNYTRATFEDWFRLVWCDELIDVPSSRSSFVSPLNNIV